MGGLAGKLRKRRSWGSPLLMEFDGDDLSFGDALVSAKY